MRKRMQNENENENEDKNEFLWIFFHFTPSSLSSQRHLCLFMLLFGTKTGLEEAG